MSTEGAQYENHDQPEPVHTARLPYFEHRVPAGPPDTIEPDGYKFVEVLRHLRRESRYAIRVMGDSTEPLIQDGDLLLVDYKRDPADGDTVCALVNGQSTVKKFIRETRSVILRPPDTKKHKDQVITETDDLRTQGVVIRIVDRETS